MYLKWLYLHFRSNHLMNLKIFETVHGFKGVKLEDISYILS